MNSTIKLLDTYKKVCLLPSDNQAALKLGITRGAVSGWRNGRSHAEPESAAAMAKACGLDVEEWVLRVQADREILAARKQVWLRAAQRLAATAAGFLIVLAYPTESPATQRIAVQTTSDSQPQEIDPGIHYAQWTSIALALARRVQAWFRGTWSLRHDHGLEA